MEKVQKYNRLNSVKKFRLLRIQSRKFSCSVIQLPFVNILSKFSHIQSLLDEYVQAQPLQRQSWPTLYSAWSIVVNAPKQVPLWPSYSALFSCKDDIFYFRVPNIWYGDKHNINSTHQ